LQPFNKRSSTAKQVIPNILIVLVASPQRTEMNYFEALLDMSENLNFEELKMGKEKLENMFSDFLWSFDQT